MNMEWSLLNNISLANKLTTYFTTNWSQDGRIFMITDVGVTILKFDTNYKNHENTLNFIKSEIKVSTYHAANETGIDMDEHLLKLTRENMYNALLDNNTTPYTKHATHMQVRPLNASWTPDVGGNAFLLILTNTGNVEIYEETNKTWTLHANLTELWVKELKKTWTKKLLQLPGDSDKLCEVHCERVSQCLATCFALSQIYYDENNVPFFFIVVGYTLEYINIWKYYYCTKKTEPIFVRTINTGLGQLTSLFVCSLNETDYIIFGNLHGLVQALPIENFNTNPLKTLNDFIDIWTHKDVRVSKILSLHLNNQLCLLVIKGPFIIFSAINAEHELVCVKYLDAENLNITGIVQFDTNSFVLTTFTGAIYHLKIHVNKNNNEYTLQLTKIKTDLKWDYHACYDLIKSPGDILWGVVTYPCKMTDHLIVRNSIQINFLLDINFDPDLYLQKQVELRPQHIPECIDVLRCISSKNSTFPNLWLTAYDKYDNLSVREIQILMWSSEFCETFLLKKPRFKKFNNPFPPFEVLKSILLFKFRLERVNKLLALDEFSPIQENSLFLLYDAMKRFQNDDNYKIFFGEKIKGEMKELEEKMTIIKLNCDMRCLYCEDKLTSEPCSTNHPDQRCCITGVQIAGLARIECEKCNMPADDHILEEKNICPLCNVPMIEIT